jgi:hypothetical protein
VSLSLGGRAWIGCRGRAEMVEYGIMSEIDLSTKAGQKSLLSPIVFTIYSSSLAGLYLIGYWSTFDINILEYVSLSDIVGLALFPILALLVSVVCGASVIVLIEGNLTNDSTLATFPPYIIRWFATASIALAIGIAYGVSSPWRWFFIAVTISLPIAFAIERLTIWESFKSYNGVRFSLIYLLVVSIPMSFAWGKLKSENIWSNHEYKQVDASIFKDTEILNGRKQLKYLGSAGEYFIFLSKDNEVTIIVKYSDLRILKLKNIQ